MIKTIYLAGGCFWGVEAYIKRLRGVIYTEAGYSNGEKLDDISYEKVCSGLYGYAEVVKVKYISEILPTEDLLDKFYKIIDPLAVNRQGNDQGVQYRTGIYYEKVSDLKAIEKSLKDLEEKLGRKSALEVDKVRNYRPAEGYHQDYLYKNPGGYCHVDLSILDGEEKNDLYKLDPARLEDLDELSYLVTQKSHTEKPFTSELNDEEAKGIYVDKITRQPLFLSSDKFDAGCGWPSFTKPIVNEIIDYRKDHSHGMVRMEVKSKLGQSHLGHVFDDGPREAGGLRYCINGASLDFIPYDKMAEKGYEDYMILLD